MNVRHLWLSLSIRARLLVSMIISVLVVVVSLQLINSSQTKKLLEHELTEKMLPNIVGKIGAEIDASVAGPLMIAQSLGSNSFVAQHLQNSSSNNQMIKAYLLGLKQQFDLSSIFLVQSDDLQIQLHSGNKWFEKKLSAANDDWYFNFIRTGKAYELNFDIDPEWGAQLFINVRTELNGRLMAVNGVGFSMESLSESISQYKIGEKGYVYLVSNQGKTIIHPNKQQLDKQLANLTTDEVATNLPSQRDATKAFDVQRDGRNLMIAAHYLPQIDAYLIAEIDQDELFSGVRDAQIKSAMFALSLMIPALLVIIWIASGLSNPIRKLTRSLTTLTAEMNLTTRIETSDRSELGALTTSFNLFMNQLQTAFTEVGDVTKRLNQSAITVADQVESMNEASGTQLNAIGSVSSAITEMDGAVRDIAGSAENSANHASEAQDSVNSSYNKLQTTCAEMEQLAGSIQDTTEIVKSLVSAAKDITTVLDVIRGVSEQTNLLALNAAIEAARAGTHGRGFAVVADEVRNLAQRTQTSTEEIQQIIEQLQHQANQAMSGMEQGVTLSSQAQEELQSAAGQLNQSLVEMKTIGELAQSVAVATEQQSQVTGEISQNTCAVNDSSREMNEGAHQVESAARDLQELADNLSQTLEKFKH